MHEDVLFCLFSAKTRDPTEDLINTFTYEPLKKGLYKSDSNMCPK